MNSTKVCDFEGCGRPMVAMGLCGSHYRQLLRRGSAAKLTPLRLETLVKLPGVHVTPATYRKLKKVNKNPYRAVQATLEAWAKGEA